MSDLDFDHIQTARESEAVALLKDIATILVHRRSLILIPFFLVLTAVVFGLLLVPKQYEARMKVMVTKDRINSEIELLKGTNLLQKPMPASLKLSPVPNTTMIQVEYSDSDPHRAVAVLSTLAERHNLAIIQPPIAPLLPSKPDVRLILTFGVLLACFFSLVVLFSFEFLRDLVERAVDLAEPIGLHVLTTSHRH